MPTDAHGFFVLFLENQFERDRTKRFCRFFLTLSLSMLRHFRLWFIASHRRVVCVSLALWGLRVPMESLCACACVCVCVWVQLKHAYAWIRIYQKDFNNRCRIRVYVYGSVHVCECVRVCECKINRRFFPFCCQSIRTIGFSVCLKPVSSDSF